MITVDWKPIDDVKSELVKGGRYWVAYYDIDGDFCSDVACWSGNAGKMILMVSWTIPT